MFVYLSYDQVTDAFAVCFHSKNIFLIASGDDEVDEGAAAVRVVSVGGSEGQYRLSHRGVLRQGAAAVLHSNTRTEWSQRQVTSTDAMLVTDLHRSSQTEASRC